MKTARQVFVILSLFTVAVVSATGCGDGAAVATSSGPGATHDGAIVTIPGGKGYVELVVKSQGKQGQLLAYFLNSGGTGPLDPAPKDVSFTPDKGKPLPLTAKSDHFESEPTPSLLAGRELNGELSVGVGGESVKVPVSTR